MSSNDTSLTGSDNQLSDYRHYLEVEIMATKLLEPFTREIVGGKEPNDQQRNFLFLPLPILRDFTNIESIVTDDYIMKYAKQPTKREIDETIEKRHLQMGQLNKWKHWKLSKLKFCLPHIGTE